MNDGSHVINTSESPSSSELERAWDRLSLQVTSAVYRSKLPTPHDQDPLRYFASDAEIVPGTPRDELPTLREFDPLRYDLEPWE